MGPSVLSLVAAGLYLFVAAFAMSAFWMASSRQQIVWHRGAWVAIAAIFVILALMRVFGIEELMRVNLRMTLYSEGAYETRRTLQGPLFAIVFLTAAAIAAGFLYFVAKGVRGRRNLAALVAIACTGGMIFLAVLRLVSLHSVDELLYGPLKMNWITDLGLSMAVLGSALRYRQVVSGAKV